MSDLPLGLRRYGVVGAAVLMAATALGWTSSAMAGYASMVVDPSSGEVLNEVNADQLNHPASLTKMMTLYLAFDALKKGSLHLDQQLPVSAFAEAKTPTKLGLRAGETITVRDCLLGMIVLSANDAAAVLGEYLGNGSETNFARIMTERAHQLGMTNTTFRNASGLPDDEQVTTARDLIKLALAIYQDFPGQYHYFSTREFIFNGRLVTGHNHLMYRYAGMDGIKTGYTGASGFNIVSSAVRDGHRLFAVVMGGQTAPARDRLMATLLDNGFAHRDTDPVLVAAAAGQDTRASHHLLARAESMVDALNPIAKAEAATLKPPAGSPPAPARSNEPWAIQVGAFTRSAQAENAADRAAHISGLSNYPIVIVSPGKGEHVYRARLTEFESEKQARDACTVLHRRGQLCVVVAPGNHAGMHVARN